MKRMAVLLLLLGLLVSFGFAQEKKAKYVGAKNCVMCHKPAKEVWEKSKHAGAYKTLLTPKANEIAKSKGLVKPAAESDECLKCHVTAHGVDKALLDPKFDMKDGVQCETCHGAGSEYKNMQIMKDRTKAVAAGLILAKGDEKVCTTCHNSGSPSFKEFNYAASWEKIKHPLPPKPASK
jgi:hypothetical protein